MSQLGRIILVSGFVLVVFGLLLWILGKSGFRGLPGDIRIESEQFEFYMPIVSCIVVSVGLTALYLLIKWLLAGGR